MGPALEAPGSVSPQPGRSHHSPPLPSRLSPCFLILQDADQRQHLVRPKNQARPSPGQAAFARTDEAGLPRGRLETQPTGVRSTSELEINVLSDTLVKCDSWPQVSLSNRLGSQLRPSQVGILMPPKADRTVSGRLPPSCENPPPFLSPPSHPAFLLKGDFGQGDNER